MSLRKIFTIITGIELGAKSNQSQQFHVWQQTRGARERALIKKEAQIGASLFGAVPAGHYREFFNLDRTTWVWFEQWNGENGQTHRLYTKYEFQPRGVLKTVNNIPKGYVEGQELDRLLNVIEAYRIKVAKEVYGRDLATV